jgi:hypothetical protein
MWAVDMSTTAGDDDQRERAADEGSGEEGDVIFGKMLRPAT